MNYKLVFLLFLGFIIISGCTQNSGSIGADIQDSSVKEDSKNLQTNKIEKEVLGELGQPIRLYNDLEITLDYLEYSSECTTYELEEIRGYYYFVKIENKGSEKHPISFLDFIMITNEKEQFESPGTYVGCREKYPFSEQYDYFGVKELLPGMHVSGWTYFNTGKEVEIDKIIIERDSKFKEPFTLIYHQSD